MCLTKLNVLDSIAKQFENECMKETKWRGRSIMLRVQSACKNTHARISMSPEKTLFCFLAVRAMIM